MASVVISGDTSGSVTLSAPAVAGTTTLTLPSTSGTVLTTASTTGISGSAISTGTVAEAYGGTGTSTGYYGFKNRIINGAMVIDQRNAGASVTPTTNQYSLDRWEFYVTQSSKVSFQQNAGSVTPPAGFKNYLGFTVGASANVTVGATDLFIIDQYIEGYNIADLGFGATGASAVTLSFWVRSSLTGTFGGSFTNSGNSRSYPFTYTINSANTWEQKTLTVSGDTSGTWLSNNGTGLGVRFSIGTGSTYLGTSGSWASASYFGATGQTNLVTTNSATFYITGVQLEKGSTATSFDYRPYTTELQLCQRYYESTAFPDAGFGIGATRIGVCLTTTAFSTGFNFLVPKRTNSPTVTLYSRNGNSGKVSLISTGADVSGTSTVSNLGGTGFWGVALGTSQTAGAGIETGWTASAEL